MTNLLTNMIVLGLSNIIPTNTPAFKEHALHAMLTNAEYLASQWKLDIPHPFTTNMVTFSQTVAQPPGLTGTIVLSNRYAFAWINGWFAQFADKPNYAMQFETSDETKNRAVLAEWSRETNHLTFKKAQKLAEQSLASVGLTRDKTNFKKPREATQLKFDDKVPLPYYKFYWKSDKAASSIDVSGITSNIVYFSNASGLMRIPKPTNYLQMLGLPTNTIFVIRRPRPPPLPPRYEVYGANDGGN
jgi:hypothetical protein